MENSQSSQCLIITGMHRSGTSLTSSLLQNAGVDIGDRLMGATEWNPKGFFEDWDFVELHQAILSSQGIASEGWTKEKSVEVQGQYLATAQNLILARKNKSIWGWKDPRTTLFLDFWLKLIPEAKFIFLFRSPWEVIDSLFRRGDFIFDSNPNFAVEQWSIYNRAILDFYQCHQDRCLLLDIKSVINNPNIIINLVNQKFQLELSSPKSLYEPSLFKVDSNIYYLQALFTKLFPNVVDLYHKLQQQVDTAISLKLQNPPIELSYESWFLQDWHDIKQALKAKNKAETEKQELETQLKEKLQETEDKLNQSQQQLHIAQQQIDQLKTLVLAMESSKFWKLRTVWFSIKEKLNIRAIDSDYTNSQK